MISPETQKKIDEYMKKEIPAGRTLGDHHVREAFKIGATFGYGLAVEEMRARTDQTQLPKRTSEELQHMLMQARDVDNDNLLEIEKLQSQNALLTEKLELAINAFEDIESHPNLKNKDTDFHNELARKALQKLNAVKEMKG